MTGGPRMMFPPPQLRQEMPDDGDFVKHAVALKRNLALTPATGKANLLALLLIQADFEQTTMGAVLDRLVRTQPSRQDQYGLQRRYRAALEES